MHTGSFNVDNLAELKISILHQILVPSFTPVQRIFFMLFPMDNDRNAHAFTHSADFCQLFPHSVYIGLGVAA